MAEPRDAEILTDFIIFTARETEGKKLSRPVASSGVGSLLKNPRHGFYVVAQKQSRICGALMVTREWSDWRNKIFWWIQSVYVVPEFRRQGVYRALYNYTREKAILEKDICGLRLYVDRSNAPARHTYEALGMSLTAYRVYEEML
jgi:ribosomal protein S18 acetylase RimI-like enzyme